MQNMMAVRSHAACIVKLFFERPYLEKLKFLVISTQCNDVINITSRLVRMFPFDYGRGIDRFFWPHPFPPPRQRMWSVAEIRNSQAGKLQIKKSTAHLSFSKSQISSRKDPNSTAYSLLTFNHEIR